MINNTITVNDGVADRNFDLVYRQGYESRRREDGVESSSASQLRIQNTIDVANTSAKNRHLVQFSWNETDATTGAVSTATVHVVIARDKQITDLSITKATAMLCALLTSTGFVDDLLVGSN